MPRPATNLRVLCPSREKRVPGDFFAYEMPDGIKRFGRLIARAVGIGFEAHPVQHLVYFFAGDEAGEFNPTKLSPHKLLIPPLVVNQKPWTLGYFQRVARIPLAEEDVLPTHCFYCPWRNKYLDEAGRELRWRVEPCGDFGLHSYRTVDDQLSEALGFAPIEDESVR